MHFEKRRLILSPANERGLSLVELTLTIGVMSFVASLTAAILLQVNTANRKMNLQQQLTILRDEFSIMLLQRKHWEATVNDTVFNNATTFACLRDGTPCNAPPPPLPGNPQGFQFTPIAYHETGDLPVAGVLGKPKEGYLPHQFGNLGFAPDGSLCQFFSSTAPSTQCPVRIDFFWRPVCATFPCTNPDVQISMRFMIRNPASAQLPYISEALYSREFNISSQQNTIAGPNECVAPRTVLVGFDGEGRVVCLEPKDVF